MEHAREAGEQARAAIEPRPRRALGCAFEVVETLVLTLLIYLVIHNFVAQPFEVQQSSMVPTIVDGEYILIDKLTNDTVGAGLIHFALRRAENIHWQALDVNKAVRSAAKGARQPRNRP